MIALLIVAPVLPKPKHDFRITFFDVGQGDATLLETPSGQTLLVDAGQPGIGARVLLPYLESNGIRKIDLAVITHDDIDHYGGLEYIVKNFTVKKILLPKDSTLSPEIRAMLTTARINGSRILQHNAPLAINGFESANIEMLMPHRNLIEKPFIDDNDLSAILKITIGKLKILLPGDMGERGESMLLNLPVDPSTDILKVGHHGSNSSSSLEFLDKIGANIAVISCGLNNRYGHPHEKVLKRLEQTGHKIYRTDIDGAVIIETDGENFTIKTLK